MSTTIGVDLGGTKILAVRLEGGVVAHTVERSTPTTGYTDVIHALVEAIESVRTPATTAVGICAPGPFDYETGVLTFSANIAGLANKPLVGDLRTALNLEVVMENDANAAAYAEHLLGASRGTRSSVFITVSTGIGAGIVIGNRIVRGAHGVAGEIGHMVLLPGAAVGTDGHSGTLETLASGRALERDATYIFGTDVSTEELFERAAAGNDIAIATVDQAARHIGLGVANLLKILDPEQFVFGGSVVTKNPEFFEQVHIYATEYATRFAVPNMVLAQLGKAGGAIGAGMLAVSPAAVYGIGER